MATTFTPETIVPDLSTESQQTPTTLGWRDLLTKAQAIFGMAEQAKQVEVAKDLWPIKLDSTEIPTLPWKRLEIRREPLMGKSDLFLYTFIKPEDSAHDESGGVRVFIVPKDNLDSYLSTNDNEPEDLYRWLKARERDGRRFHLDGPKASIVGRELTMVIKSRIESQPGERNWRTSPDILRLEIGAWGVRELVVDRVLVAELTDDFDLSALSVGKGLLVTEPIEIDGSWGDPKKPQVPRNFFDVIRELTWDQEPTLVGGNVVLLTENRAGNTIGNQPEKLRIMVKPDEAENGLVWEIQRSEHSYNYYRTLLDLMASDPEACQKLIWDLNLKSLEQLANVSSGINAIKHEVTGSDPEIFLFNGTDKIKAPIRPGLYTFYEGYETDKRTGKNRGRQMVQFMVRRNQSGNLICKVTGKMEHLVHAKYIGADGLGSDVFVDPTTAAQLAADEVAWNKRRKEQELGNNLLPPIRMSAAVRRANSPYGTNYQTTKLLGKR